MRKKNFLNAQKLEFGHRIENLFYFHNCLKNKLKFVIIYSIEISGSSLNYSKNTYNGKSICELKIFYRLVYNRTTLLYTYPQLIFMHGLILPSLRLGQWVHLHFICTDAETRSQLGKLCHLPKDSQLISVELVGNRA